jgi:hypothetical protein
MGDFGNGVEQFSEHFQVRCRVSLLIGHSTDFFRAAPILADSIEFCSKAAPGPFSDLSGRGCEVRFTSMKPTSPVRAIRSEKCQSTKSLRSSPLRGVKSREAGSQLREASDSGVASINSRIVGVQRMIKNNRIISNQATL